MRNGWSHTEQGLAKQLQLDKWPACHSLSLNTQDIHKAETVTEAQIKQIRQAGHMLPLLQCLHIIGSDPDIIMAGGSIQALLVEVLAKHVSVLTLNVYTAGVPLNLPNLQHLALHLVPTMKEPYEALFPSIEMLVNLKTLYVSAEYHSFKMRGHWNLQGCARLQHVALRNIHSEGALTLPAGCLLHWFGSPLIGMIIDSALANVVYGLTLRHDTSRWNHIFSSNVPLLKWAPKMQQLKLLRLTLSEDPLGMLTNYSPWSPLDIDVSSGIVPCLEVLELDAQCSLRVNIDPIVPLRSIIVITTGHVVLRQLSAPSACNASKNTLKQLYIQSSAPIRPACKEWLKKSNMTERWAQMKRCKGNKGGWTFSLPASFTPRDLQDCYCNACPECLVQAGVPILCDKAWISNSFHGCWRPMI